MIKLDAVKQPQQSDTEQIQIHNVKVSSNSHKHYIVKQRACGIVLLIIAILTAVISNDATASVVLVPLALYITLTHKHVMCF